MNEKYNLNPSLSYVNPLLQPMNEFSRFIDIKKLTALPARLTFIADEKEKEALAKRLGLIKLKTLEVTCYVDGKMGHDPLHVSAVIKAKVTQSCVVSLKDLPHAVEEPVKLSLFLSAAEMEAVPETFEEDQPEPVLLDKNGTVDVGEIFVQYLSLALDPYPKFETDNLSL